MDLSSSFAAYAADPVGHLSLLLAIIGADIALAGDNAIVIGAAAANLEGAQRRRAIWLGGLAAAWLRIIFMVLTTYLLRVPFLQVVGAGLLFWVTFNLLKGEEEGEGEGIKPGQNLAEAVKIIIVADASMSLDNVLAVGALAHGDIPMIVIGILISVGFVMFAGSLIATLMEKFPMLLLLAGGILGWVATDMIFKDPWVAANVTPMIPSHDLVHQALPVLVGLGFMAWGYFRQRAAHAHAA